MRGGVLPLRTDEVPVVEDEGGTRMHANGATAGRHDGRSTLWFAIACLVVISSLILAAHRMGGDRRDCPTCPEMVPISGGAFRMGDETSRANPEERPVHLVEVPGFAMSKYEVTFAEWDACVAAGACSDEIFDQEWGRGRRPVVNVGWDEAQTYVQWLSKITHRIYRLPSEAQWEYAARAGAQTRYSWGDDMLPGRAVCYSECGEEADKSAVVGSTAPNAFGLHDLHGNVWEWVEDCWNDTYDSAPADGSARNDGDCERRVVRGGGWLNYASELRSAVRMAQPTSIHFSSLGFRVVRID